MPTFRLAQPHAAVVIDSVDVAFAREELMSKVCAQSVVKPEETKRRELAMYRAADARDVHQMIELTATYHTPARGRVLASKARLWWAETAVSTLGNC